MNNKIKTIWVGGSFVLSFLILGAFCVPIAYRLGQAVVKVLGG